MWFKYGLKAQKLLAQGNTLGFSKILAMRPVRAKALKLQAIIKLLPLQGDMFANITTQGVALG